jgi:hypothetical protein
MSDLMRMAYGRSGSRLGRILVSGPHRESVVDPLWLKVLLLLIWITIPVLVSRFAIPTATRQLTFIDVSRLTAKPRTEREIPLIPKPRQAPQVRHHEPPPPKPDKSPAPTEQKPLERPTVAPPPEVPEHPSISRPFRTGPANVQEYRPRIVRERLQPGMESGTPSATRIRRETASTEVHLERATITRTRGAAAVDVTTGTRRVAALRRSPSMDEPSWGAGSAPRIVTRHIRTSGSSGFSGTTEGTAPRITVARGRTKLTGTGREESDTPVGLVRGISFMSLEICSSLQEEEDGIKAVLSVVGSRQSCTNEKGEFQFIATQRISSFNLIIFPAKGRRPTNRCEELKNAYRCLKTH